jgi:predicted permease
VLLPVLLFVNIYEIGSVTDVDWAAVLFCVGAVVALFLLGIPTALLGTKEPLRKGVLWQCVFRSNYNIIGLPLAAALGGEEALAFAAIVAALVVPLYNVFAVISLCVFVSPGEGKKPSVKKILLDILKNPLIIAAILGAVCLVIRALENKIFGSVVFSLQRDLKFLYSPLNSLKTMATPLALVVLGGQFKFSLVKGMFREIAVGTALRLLVAPVLGLAAALLLDKLCNLSICDPVTVPGILCVLGAPVAVSSAVMASQMGNDEQLAAQLVVWTSIGSMITVFALVCGLMAMGLLSI